MSPHPSSVKAPAVVALALLTAAAYLPLARAGFVNLDDPLYVAANPVVAAGLTTGGVAWAFTTFHAGNWHPLTWLSHLADVSLFGLNPVAFHLVNVLLHLAASLLLLVLLVSLTGRWPVPLLVAFLFALHPLHVEPVAWISQRKELLSALFWFLAALAHLAHARRPRPASLARACLLYLPALLSKPTAVTWPLVMLLLDFWPLGRWGRGPRSAGTPSPLGGCLREKLPALLLASLAAAATLSAQTRSGAVQPLANLDLTDRLANAAVSSLWYLGRAVLPLKLAVWYPLPREGWPLPLVLGAAAALAALTAAALLRVRARPWLAVGWAWYLTILLPTIGLVQVGGQARADRYVYLPLAGILLAVVANLPGDRRRLRLFLPLVPLLAILALLTGRQAARWRDSRTLLSHAVAVTEGNWMAHHNLAVELSGAGDQGAAERHFRAALAIYPTWPPALNGLGNVLARAGRSEEALALYREALALDPGYGEAHYNLGVALLRARRPREAREELRLALEADPSLGPARDLLGLLEGRGGLPPPSP
jgi:tetratricopeptide (TPR) repeat protein